MKSPMRLNYDHHGAIDGDRADQEQDGPERDLLKVSVVGELLPISQIWTQRHDRHPPAAPALAIAAG
jgi:hypothetical protein